MRSIRTFIALGAAAAFALMVAACSTPAGAPGAAPVDPAQSLYKSVIAADYASATVFQTTASLEAECQIKPAGATTQAVNLTFIGISGGLSSANADVQAGKTDLASTALTSALASLQAVQPGLATTPVTPAVKARLMARVKAGRLAGDAAQTSAIISLVIQDLPILLADGSQLVGVVQSSVNQLNGGQATSYSPADVAKADAVQVAALAAWTAAGKTVCK